MASHNTIKKALLEKNFKKVDYLLEMVSPVEHADYPLLCELIYYNQVDLFKKALKKGWSIQTVDNLGHYPIHLAVLRGNLECVDLLVNAGANLNQSKENKTHATTSYTISSAFHVFPLHNISELESKYWYKMIEKLMSLGAHIHIKDECDCNILHLLSLKLEHFHNPEDIQEMKKVVQFCIENGLDINDQDYLGDTILIQLTSIEEAFSIIDLLIDNGADIYRFNRLGNTAQDYLSMSGLNSDLIWKNWEKRSDAFFEKKNLNQCLPEASKFKKEKRI